MVRVVLLQRLGTTKVRIRANEIYVVDPPL